jgi:hypothetical protein
MTSPPAWADALRPLTELCDALAIPLADLESHERLLDLALLKDGVDPRRSAALADVQRNALRAAYGDAVRCQLLHDGEVVIDFAEIVDAAMVDAQHASILARDALTFDLRLDKEALLADWLGPSGWQHRFLYFFPASFERFLCSPLPELEKRLWGETGQHNVVVLLPSREIWLDGPRLAVLGGAGLAFWQPDGPTTPPAPPGTTADDPALQMYQRCQALVKWQETWLQHLTPLHLQTTCTLRHDDLIAARLRVHHLNLLLLYTAERTFKRAGGWVSVYHGASRAVEVPWVAADPAPPLSADDVAALYRLLEWTYREEWVEDRLPILQNVVSEALQGAEPEQRPAAMLGLAAALDHNARRHWQALVDGKVQSYMTEVRALEEYVATRVQAFSDQVSGMLKTLLDAMLAAVAALVASFIIALFRPGFDYRVFGFGLLIYAAYLFLFPLLYNMSDHAGKLRLAVGDLDQHLQRFRDRLGDERVQEIVGDRIEASRRRFWRWYWLALAAYLVVLVLAVSAGLLSLFDPPAIDAFAQQVPPAPTPTSSAVASPTP